jgi:hypothetical protein
LSASAEAVCVDPKQVHIIWPEVSHWIKRAMERGDLGTFVDTEADVLSGRALLWLAWDAPKIEAAVVTKLGRSEKTKSCVIVACGGERSERWASLIEQIENYARAEGCDAVRIFGRRGWARVYPEYRVAKILLERRL